MTGASGTGHGDVHTVVVGAGIAGLAAASEASEYGDVRLLEAADRVGGTIRSVRHETSHGGWLCESAAGSVNLPAPGLSTLLATTGAGLDVLPADTRARRRWIYDHDGLFELPGSPPAFLRSRLVSPWAKLGLLAEPFVARRSPRGAPDGEAEESVTDFVARRFGAEIASRIAQPLVAGVFAGNASATSVDAAFPVLRELEQASGSVTIGGLRRMRTARQADAPRPSLHSFRDGMEALPRHLAASLGDGVAVDTPAGGVARVNGRWHIETPAGEYRADQVVLATDPDVAAGLLDVDRPVDSELARLVADIPRAPAVMLHLGVPEDTLGDMHGFGVLAHPRARLRILGALFDSRMFPGRAPDGYDLVRIVMGGALDPDAIDLDDATLVETAVSDLATVLGHPVAPVFSNVVRHRPGIPQYVLGHRERIAEVDRRLTALPGLRLVGWGYRGVGVNSLFADVTRQIRS